MISRTSIAFSSERAAPPTFIWKSVKLSSAMEGSSSEPV
jgi:hypothetical protein